MHELAIAENIFSTVLGEMEARRLAAPVKIGLCIGSLSGVAPDALSFSFDIIKAETPLAETRLDIERRPARGACQQCGRRFDLEEPAFLCPNCGSHRIQVKDGRQLDITYLEVPE
ncbi:MAG: hydrogenase maturation nickel metallochaperone HypA [Acidobacteriota bacterium]|nr:hydrogenase maturation nickel metallochaperone HypA [Acidobacteriota bacterium]